MHSHDAWLDLDARIIELLDEVESTTLSPPPAIVVAARTTEPRDHRVPASGSPVT